MTYTPGSEGWPSPTVRRLARPHWGHSLPSFGQKTQALDRHVRRKVIEPNLKGLSISKQCAWLSVSRSSFYYQPKGETEMNLGPMRVIDKQFLETPFFGVRQLTWDLGHHSMAADDAVT